MWTADRERGDTLLELVIAVAIMGVALVAVLGGFATSILMSDIHRQQATAGTAARDYAEAVQNMVAGGGYVACASTTTYASPPGFAAPTGYTKSVVSGSMRYWNGTAWQTGCTTATDTGLQRLTVRIASDDTRPTKASEDVVVVLRKPCRLTDALCG